MDTFSVGTCTNGPKIPLLGPTAQPILIPATKGVFLSNFGRCLYDRDPCGTADIPGANAQDYSGWLCCLPVLNGNFTFSGDTPNNWTPCGMVTRRGALLGALWSISLAKDLESFSRGTSGTQIPSMTSSRPRMHSPGGHSQLRLPVSYPTFSRGADAPAGAAEHWSPLGLQLGSAPSLAPHCTLLGSAHPVFRLSPAPP